MIVTMQAKSSDVLRLLPSTPFLFCERLVEEKTKHVGGWNLGLNAAPFVLAQFRQEKPRFKIRDQIIIYNEGWKM